MAKLKISVHPLFFAFGIYFALTGKVFSFAVYTLAAVIHELGHSYVAERLGYRLKSIMLMPFGAIVSGEQELFSYSDEIKIALAGPMVNLLTALSFVALWWLAPEIYAYTDVAVFASVTLATINLLPCYPLDGGRLLLAFLSRRINRKTAVKIVKISGFALFAALLCLFIISVFNTVNFSLLFFSLFVLVGNVGAGDKYAYVRIFAGVDMRAVAKGREIKKIAVLSTTEIKRLYKFAGVNDVVELSVFSKAGKIKLTLTADKVSKLLSEGKPYLSVEEEARRLDLIL